ncbi:MAG: hypothetical protein H6604_00265 [Flavobacteriales bacterium]|nr:hypothetical protein [Flavobacteriales bacterium]
MEIDKSKGFEPNKEYKLKKMSFVKKITYFGYIILISTLAVSSLLIGRFAIHWKNNDIEYSNYSLYILILAGLVFIFHFSAQLIGQNIKNETQNNLYYKYSYNSKIIGIILIILAVIVNILQNSKLTNQL